MLVKREEDGKVIMVSRQKVRVHESIYLRPMSEQTTHDEISKAIAINQPASQMNIGGDVNDSTELNVLPPRPETDNNLVQSIKSLRNHKHKIVRDLGIGFRMVPS